MNPDFVAQKAYSDKHNAVAPSNVEAKSYDFRHHRNIEQKV